MSITKKIEYWDRTNESKVTESGFRYVDTSSKKIREEDLTANTEDALFEKFYKLNNSLKYCNGSYYKFVNEQDQADYFEWLKNLSHERNFNLYYGNGVVD
jgi:hypothetical protein